MLQEIIAFMKIKKIQVLRAAVQLAYIALLVAGFFTALRPLSLVLFFASLLFGNFFCGWLCVFGTMQDFVSRISSVFIKRKFKMPYRVQRWLQLSRYVLFLVLAIAIGREAGGLAFNSYRTAIGVVSGRELEVAAISFFSVFLVISVFFDRPFCSYVCSEGVHFGIASFTRIFSIKRNSASCVQCGKCDRACPMNIRVSSVNHVRSAQCVNCFKCISECPSKKTLGYGFVNVFSILKMKILRFRGK
jgi:polyferredoxin